MDRDMLLGALVVFLLAVIVFISWLYAHALWPQSRLAEDASIAFADDDQQIKAVQRKGLDKAMIEALPTFVYTSAEGLKSVETLPRLASAHQGEACSSGKLHNIECPVCLSEFQHKERGRELPKCKHRFHVECIDTWLHANATCPVCRASCAAEINGGAEEALQVMDDQMSGSNYDHMGITYPTNVLFWGNNSRVTSRTSTLEAGHQGPPSSSIIQIYTRELPLDVPPSLPSPSSRTPTLNPLRRLLISREMHISPLTGAHSHTASDSPSTHIPISKA